MLAAPPFADFGGVPAAVPLSSLLPQPAAAAIGITAAVARRVRGLRLIMRCIRRLREAIGIPPPPSLLPASAGTRRSAGDPGRASSRRRWQTRGADHRAARTAR